MPGELGKKDKPLPILMGRENFVCPKCSLQHMDPLDSHPEETSWVFCPVCQVALHTCIATNCVCKYKPCAKYVYKLK